MQDNDFKYVMDDLYRISLGTHLTYAEIIENTDISYKFRQICKQYFVQEVAEDTTLESHLYYLSPKDRSYDTYRHLKAKVLCMVAQPGKVQKDGSPVFAERVLDIKELASLSPDTKKALSMVIREVTVSKVGLMTMVL